MTTEALHISVSRPAYSDLCGSPYSVRGPGLGSPQDDAAIQMQKRYRGYRIRRQLADCAVLARDYGWWNVLEGIILRRNIEVDKEHDDASRRWMRAGKKAAKLGKGLSKDETARQLAFQHWLEAIDARHRYGHNLHKYYKVWVESGTNEPFFFWLDVGEGRLVDLHAKGCSREKLFEQQIAYLGPTQRRAFEVTVQDGKLLYTSSRKLVDSESGSQDDKWIFVMSTTGRIYVGQKKKGKFQHSSFLAGGVAKAAGRLVASNGVLKLIEAHSGHYRPTEEDFKGLLCELETRGVDLSKVKIEYTSREMAKRKKSRKDESGYELVAKQEVSVEQPVKENGSHSVEAEASRLAELVVSTLKEASTPKGSGARLQSHVVDRKAWRRPPKLEISKSFHAWTSEGGARLFSLSIIPHDLRTRALEVVGTPRESTVRCGRGEYGPLTAPPRVLLQAKLGA